MNQVRVGVGVIVRDKSDRILLGKRKGSHGAGEWSLPGGHLEFGESFEDCCAREVKEETNLDVRNAQFKTLTNDIFEKEGLHYITLFFEVDLIRGTPVVLERDKCECWQWCFPHSLPEPLFLPLRNILSESKLSLI